MMNTYPKYLLNKVSTGGAGNVNLSAVRIEEGCTYGGIQNGPNRVDIRPEEEELANLSHDFCETKRRGHCDISLVPI